MLTQTASTANGFDLGRDCRAAHRGDLEIDCSTHRAAHPRQLQRHPSKLYHAWLAGRAPSDTNLANYLTELFDQGRPPKAEDDRPEPQAPGSLALVVNAVRWCEREGEAQGRVSRQADPQDAGRPTTGGQGPGRWSTTGPQPRPGYPLWLMRPSAPIPRPGPGTPPCCW